MNLEEWHLREGDDSEERFRASAYLPILDAHQAEAEPDRIERLRRVYSTAQNLFLIVEGRRLPERVVIALYDHKGELRMTFADQAWQDFLTPLFQLAWRSEGESIDRVRASVRQ